MGGQPSKTEERDTNREERVETAVKIAKDAKDSIDSAVTNIDKIKTNMTSDSVDTDKNKLNQYKIDVNGYIEYLDSKISDKGLTKDETDDYIKIKNEIVPYQTAINKYAELISDKSAVNVVNNDKTMATYIQGAAAESQKKLLAAQTKLKEFTEQDYKVLKQEQAIIADKHADFIFNLNDKNLGSSVLKINGAQFYNNEADGIKKTVSDNAGLAQKQKEDASKKYVEATTLYANYHDSAWLRTQIERIKGLLSQEEAEKITHTKTKTDDETNAQDKNDELYDLIQKFKKEKSKGSAFDQKEAELNDLIARLALCESALEAKKQIGTDYDMSMNALNINGLINSINDIKQDIIDISGVADKNKKIIIDLSGDIIKVTHEIDRINNIIGDDEINIKNLNKHINDLNILIVELTQKIYSNKIYNNQHLLKLSEDIDKNLQYIFSDLKTENINPDLLYKKIKYRDIESQKLHNRDKILDVLFYCFYFSFIIIGVVTRNVKIENFLIYLIIGLIPFLYPFVYKNATHVFGLLHLDVNKNAFIEDQNTIDAYNI